MTPDERTTDAAVTSDDGINRSTTGLFREVREDERGPMTMDQRTTWVYLMVLLATGVTYAAIVVPRAVREPLDEVSWVVPMIWMVGISIGATIGGAILAALGSALGLAARGRAAEVNLDSDERDKEIQRLGHMRAYVSISVGMLGVLILAMLDAHTFWIGNLIYASGLVGGVIETSTKIRAYRNGL